MEYLSQITQISWADLKSQNQSLYRIYHTNRIYYTNNYLPKINSQLSINWWNGENNIFIWENSRCATASGLTAWVNTAPHIWFPMLLFRATKTTQINLGIKQMELMDQETKYSEIYKGCTVFLLPFQSMKKYNENIFSA